MTWPTALKLIAFAIALMAVVGSYIAARYSK
jgi:hypothetical protein